MAERNILNDLFRRVVRNRRGQTPGLSTSGDLVKLCKDLLTDRGEISGLYRAQGILDRLDRSTDAEKTAFFLRVARELGVDEDALTAAIAKWSPGDVDAARDIHFAAEPRSQELIRALNRVPGATARLVGLRACLLSMLHDTPALRGLDRDFRHLFSSWFNRGFLHIHRIDWSTPANILEKIIAYEAVHEITGWDDLRQRVGDPDRRLFAFFHPAMPSEPLIFVEVALTGEIPGAIGDILRPDRSRFDPAQATTAVFYSISNCQKGLSGISFGNFLIKQVVTELQRELPDITTFVTLSPVPLMRQWVMAAVENGDPLISAEDRATLATLDKDARPPTELTVKLAARYLTRAKRQTGTAFDPVAHFHIGNGAILQAIHPDADPGPQGMLNSWGVMVNYQYDGTQIEARHQAYATHQDIAMTPAVRALAKD
ncbi:malonyl-CoA decarboxylase [Thalassovita sp.]|uniref:malonyl-CoA decarboxylase n=1 Tax=Thalassovita sp. TaxID=1979401 RepID=UPI0029DE8BF0|nr:malonyl-CoA decarboxylase [Thalassovita sp.]